MRHVGVEEIVYVQGFGVKLKFVVCGKGLASTLNRGIKGTHDTN